MPYGTVNADVIGTSVAGSNIGAGNASIMKNRIINGAQVISQRYGTASQTIPANNAYYVTDRFMVRGTQASKVTAAQNAGSVTPPAGFTNYLGVTSSSAYSVTSTDYFVVESRIEGYNIADLAWGTANAKTVTLSFWVYSSLTGTFGGSLNNSGLSRNYPFSYTISSANTWQQISVTIAGDTTGTWLTDNGIGMSVILSLGAGSTLAGSAGSWSGNTYVTATGATSVVGTNGATFYITGVQLEVGSSATGFEYRQYQQELALCQRYFYTIDSNGIQLGIAPSTTELWINIFYPTRLRAAATVTLSGSLQISNNVTADFTSTSPAILVYQGTSVGSRTKINGFTGLTFGAVYGGYTTGTPSGQLFYSAEL